MRVANRVLAALLAVALAVAGVVATIEIALAEAGDAHWLADWRAWRSWGLDHDWTTTAVRVTCYGLCAGGLILVVMALARHRPISLDVKSDRPDIAARVHRSGLEAALQRAALNVDGIARAGVHISRSQARVTALSNRRDIAGLQDTITATASQRLAALRLTEPPALRVRVRSRSQ